jgi:hypothetical protein
MQLVNSTCGKCRRRISSTLDGRFCPQCKTPIHNQCDIASEQQDTITSHRCSVCSSIPSPRVIHDKNGGGRFKKVPLWLLVAVVACFLLVVFDVRRLLELRSITPAATIPATAKATEGPIMVNSRLPVGITLAGIIKALGTPQEQGMMAISYDGFRAVEALGHLDIAFDRESVGGSANLILLLNSEMVTDTEKDQLLDLQPGDPARIIGKHEVTAIRAQGQSGWVQWRFRGAPETTSP